MVDFEPGDPHIGKRTYTAHDQHDSGKVRALEGKDWTKLKEIGVKTNKNNKNGQTGTADLGIGNDWNDSDNMLISDNEVEDKEDAEDRKIT